MDHKCALQNICVHYRIYVCITEYMCALQNICVHYRIYVCITEHMCALQNICVHYRTYVHYTEHMCALQNIFIPLHVTANQFYLLSCQRYSDTSCYYEARRWKRELKLPLLRSKADISIVLSIPW